MRSHEPESVRHLYIHIPFCPTKCGYCAFVNHVGSLKLMEPYLQAVRSELESLRVRRTGGPLLTVYVGGGTPSLMSGAQCASLLGHVADTFGFAAGVEITLEAHPLTVNAASLRAFRDAGVTRLSFGVESFNEEELRQLGRPHSAQEGIRAVRAALAAGFQSVNLDLMYGIPAQTPESWRRSLDTALQLAPPHLSLYPLSIEPRTVFARRWRQNMLSLPGDDTVADMYHIACGMLRGVGYEHYEVANWALTGHQSAHNLAYWHNQEFYAAGVGAHGYLHPYRTENVSQTKRYIERVLAGEDPVHRRELIDPAAEITETVMLQLRLLREGLAPGEIRERFSFDLEAEFGEDIQELLTLRLLEREGERLVLPEKAAPLGNEIWGRFVLS